MIISLNMSFQMLLVPRFCGSMLWQRQSLPTPFPGALSEKEFVVPGESLLSNDTRRNLTDLQETSQWIGGGRVPTAILTALFSRLCIDLMVLMRFVCCFDLFCVIFVFWFAVMILVTSSHWSDLRWSEGTAGSCHSASHCLRWLLGVGRDEAGPCDSEFQSH